MNASSASTSTRSRAQLSPLSRRVVRTPARASASDLYDYVTRGPGNRLGFVPGQLWTPGLLDRLQEPLTRYHE